MDKPRHRVAFRQCDFERAIRAAKATGAGVVMVWPDGTRRGIAFHG